MPDNHASLSRYLAAVASAALGMHYPNGSNFDAMRAVRISVDAAAGKLSPEQVRQHLREFGCLPS